VSFDSTTTSSLSRRLRGLRVMSHSPELPEARAGARVLLVIPPVDSADPIYDSSSGGSRSDRKPHHAGDVERTWHASMIRAIHPDDAHTEIAQARSGSAVTQCARPSQMLMRRKEDVMGRMLQVAAALAVIAVLNFLETEVALAQDTDGFTVHCVPLLFLDPRFGECDDFHATIQDAVDHAEGGETVLVAAGTYPEQVHVIRPLTLEGAGSTVGGTTIRPVLVTPNTTSLFSGAPIDAILLVDGTTGVAVSDLTVDGMLAAFPSCSPGYVGIFYRASSGAIQSTHVTNIHEPATAGCQARLAIFVQSANGGPGLNSSVSITNNKVDVYGKNGITANEPGTFVTVTGNTVMGRGPTTTGDAAQNGVQIGFGARLIWAAAHLSSPPAGARIGRFGDDEPRATDRAGLGIDIPRDRPLDDRTPF